MPACLVSVVRGFAGQYAILHAAGFLQAIADHKCPDWAACLLAIPGILRLAITG
ncbi:MAG: hypothetical protein ACYC44_00305 [Patescibacteria group bacterium]